MSFWSFLPTALTAASVVYGANLQSKTNDKATRQMVEAQNRATQAQVDALNTARQELNVNRQAASPGLLATQEIIARGARLTPQQETAVADSRAQALNALRGSSLRGSARTTSAIVSDTDQRTRDNFMAQNQNRADTAGLQLAGQYFGAGRDVANTAAQTGSAVSQGLTNNGIVTASNTMGQGNLMGQTIGDVGSIIANSMKDDLAKERDSSYRTTINWNDGSTSRY